MHREGAEPGSRERAWPGQGGGMRRGAQPHLHLPEIKTRPRRGQGSATGISRGPLHPLLTSPLGARSPHLGQPPVGWWGEAFALFFKKSPQQVTLLSHGSFWKASLLGGSVRS